MGVAETLQYIGACGSLMSMIVMVILGYMYLYHPRCKKDKVLFYKTEMIFHISIDILIFFVYLFSAPLFYDENVSLNIKLGLIFIGIASTIAGALRIKIDYKKYKNALRMKKEITKEIGVRNGN